MAVQGSHGSRKLRTSMATGKKRKQIKNGGKFLISKPGLRDLLPLARLYPLPKPLKTVPPPGDQMFKYLRLWRTFVIKTTP